MQTQMLEMMARIDDLCEQQPSEPFERLVALEVSWSPDQTDPVGLAAARMLDGLWLYYLGNWCPDDWDALLWKGTEIVGTDDAPLGYQLMIAGVELRNDGCRLASYYATPSHLSTLRSQIPPASHPRAREFQESVLTWMGHLYVQRHDEHDWFGTPLPASIAVLSAAFRVSEPYHKQGNTSEVTQIALGRKAYFVKRLIEPGPMMTLFDAFQTECAVAAVLQCLPMKVGPHTGCLYADGDGTLTYLSNKVPGVAMTDIRKAASRVSLASVQAAVLAEILCNAHDRHHENAYIDRIHAQPWLIDFAHSLDEEQESVLLPDARLPLGKQRESFTRALWTWHPDCLRTTSGETIILEEVLAGVLAAQEAVVAALGRFALSDVVHGVVARRFAALEQLAQVEGDKTLEHLNHLVS